MRLLASDPEIDDESIGFHAQQAVEKWLKAVMAAHELPQKRKHSLALLLDILAAAEIEEPPGADWLDELSIYAVPLRYDERLDLEPLDREAVLGLVAEIGDWAERLSG
jgi:HEPN domain-containing protein